MVDTPADIIEYGFFLAYQRQEEFHHRWRALHEKLQGLRKEAVPYDSGDHDAYFDCFLRQLEDEQRDYLAANGRVHPHGRTRMQIQLSRYWIVGVSELFRVTKKTMDPSDQLFAPVSEMQELFGAFRIMISKQEPQGVSFVKKNMVPKAHIAERQDGGGTNEISATMGDYVHEGTYRVPPIFNKENGGVCFPVYDGKSAAVRTEDRRVLSDRALQAFSV